MTKLNNTVAGTFAIAATLVTIAAATPLRAEPARVAVAHQRRRNFLGFD